MVRTSLLSAAVAISAITGPALADPLPSVSAPTASSTAAVVDSVFVVNGKKTNPAPELSVSGSAPPTYDKKTERSTYAHTTKIAGGLTFTRSATKIESEASGHAAKATGVASKGEATVSGFAGKLTSPLGTLLTVTSGPVSTQATFTQTKAGVVKAQGAVKIGNLKIDAPVLGITKTFNGSPAPNKILYQNNDKSIIVYLNHQVVTKLAGKVTGITVQAVDVQVNNFTLGDTTFSGTLMVEPTSAK
jgi:hypothetical protein